MDRMELEVCDGDQGVEVLHHSDKDNNVVEYTQAHVGKYKENDNQCQEYYKEYDYNWLFEDYN